MDRDPLRPPPDQAAAPALDADLQALADQMRRPWETVGLVPAGSTRTTLDLLAEVQKLRSMLDQCKRPIPPMPAFTGEYADLDRASWWEEDRQAAEHWHRAIHELGYPPMDRRRLPAS